MVKFHFKKSDTEQFLAEGKTTEKNEDVITRLVKIWNTRLRVERLCGYALQLADYGPAKPAKERGLDHLQEEADQAALAHGEAVPDRKRNEYYQEDPLGGRTGNRCKPELAAVIKKTVEDARAAVHANQVKMKIPLTLETMQEKIDNIRGAVMICYPMGLPPYDEVRQEIEDNAEIPGMGGQAVLDPEDVSMWWAGKEFVRGKLISDRLGRNEKTKIVIKLQKKGAGAPAREPAVTEDERKAMMAHYFKKQEEAKKLADDDDDGYTNSSWADSKALKKGLTGTGSVAFRPGMRM
eukprot:g4056.t1